MDRQGPYEPRPIPGIAYALAGTLASATVAGLIAVAVPRPADALPSYTQQTGASCGRCHVTPTGGKLTAFGNAFVASGHKVPAKGAKPAKGGAPDATPPVAAPAADAPPPGRALDYVPWTLHRPYYSHFIYSPDDYR
jgi:hypothetical protein